MNSVKYIICVVLLGLLVTGCAYRPRVGPPWAQKLLMEGPQGSNEFQEGWRDGCETGISVTANTFIRHFYTFKQNSSLARNSDYYTAWKTAYTYCQRYVFQYLRRDYL